MRKGLLLAFMLFIMVAFSGCKPILSEKIIEDINENSNLEIKLLATADAFDSSSFDIIPGGMGVEGYYDKKYGDVEVDEESLYQCYVQYDVTSYPDVVFGDERVTGIFITDPEIYIYDYSVGDNSQEFSDLLKEKGFEEYYNNGHLIKFSKKKVEIRCGVNAETQEINSIYIGVDVTNISGAIF